jgi:predicted TIM-barrel fold metal-dependent hydrolase
MGHCGFPWHWEAWSLVTRHPNVYLDVSAYYDLYNHLPWDAYSKHGAEDKILFATDSPLCNIQATIDALKAVDISPEFRKKILGENAARLLGIPLES